jgi:hypothetical protein
MGKKSNLGTQENPFQTPREVEGAPPQLPEVSRGSKGVASFMMIVLGILFSMGSVQVTIFTPTNSWSQTEWHIAIGDYATFFLSIGGGLIAVGVCLLFAGRMRSSHSNR